MCCLKQSSQCDFTDLGLAEFSGNGNRSNYIYSEDKEKLSNMMI